MNKNIVNKIVKAHLKDVSDLTISHISSDLRFTIEKVINDAESDFFKSKIKTDQSEQMLEAIKLAFNVHLTRFL